MVIRLDHAARRAVDPTQGRAFRSGYATVLESECERLAVEHRKRIRPDLLPLHQALPAALERARLGHDLLDAADLVSRWWPSTAAALVDAAGPWLEDAAELGARLRGGDADHRDRVASILGSGLWATA